MEWEKKAYDSAVSSLSPGFEIFDFQVAYSKSGARITVYLDKLDDAHGSPNIEECEQFSHVMSMKLDAMSENTEMPDYSLEVSSPGAERELKIPDDFERFAELPMKVRYAGEDGRLRDGIFELKDKDAAMTIWCYADVKANRRDGLQTKKNREKEFNIPIENIEKVKLYVDI